MMTPQETPVSTDPTPIRVLITGSRTWDDTDTIRDAILTLATSCGRDNLTIVHGHCPKGADAIADRLAQTYPGGPIAVERHPAQWYKHGKKAGFIRNKEMVELGADVCLAFIKDESRGATMCADLAELEGIQVYRFYAESQVSV
jgi:hypothetical protein